MKLANDKQFQSHPTFIWNISDFRFCWDQPVHNCTVLWTHLSKQICEVCQCKTFQKSIIICCICWHSNISIFVQYFSQLSRAKFLKRFTISVYFFSPIDCTNGLFKGSTLNFYNESNVSLQNSSLDIPKYLSF